MDKQQLIQWANICTRAGIANTWKAELEQGQELDVIISEINSQVARLPEAHRSRWARIAADDLAEIARVQL